MFARKAAALTLCGVLFHRVCRALHCVIPGKLGGNAGFDGIVSKRSAGDFAPAATPGQWSRTRQMAGSLTSHRSSHKAAKYTATHLEYKRAGEAAHSAAL